jgi:hypothetical protein
MPWKRHNFIKEVTGDEMRKHFLKKTTDTLKDCKYFAV